MRNEFWLFLAITVPGVFALIFFVDVRYAYSLLFFLPTWLVGLYDIFQVRHTLKSNYPLLGRLRYVMEELRPKIYQYFVESDTDGTPISRILRSVVYQRAKRAIQTKPFGTQLNVYEEGHEWINHSIYPANEHNIEEENLRVVVGSNHCDKPYSLSLLNISAMSYGALSHTAVEALNAGARLGRFAHNTGEGGISDFHKRGGGDIIWQIGTGYFGARNADGTFSEEKFQKNALLDQVKMIELKLSQGAKPGHGGILPAKKNTQEIAAIRGVEPFTTVASPPFHSAFSNSDEMILFIAKLRKLSGGKPIGIKLCYGKDEEFRDLCQAMRRLGDYPDYIAIDGAEGGTGAAPLEFSDSIGTPLVEGLVRAKNLLDEYGLKHQIKLIASGKIITGFHIVRALSLGADACYSARGMMLALGCIQALLCNTNKCPAGIATQDPTLAKGLNVKNKAERIANFHGETIQAVKEIIAAAGYEKAEFLTRRDIFRRVGPTKVASLEEIYPSFQFEKREEKIGHEL
ncbi:FMN-binding glutamate synthase family protein [Bacteriovorax sp. Seq25_V]|uniref:FMN-binding glutamate synthase family protein n=1 Tax=Bacteriovorax sp. Seq25_V TaxID=1201288 RepID=UPI00038A0F6F|nr:FMN-binding glutamate synthase family protein [Bacteriovorax sp. Seq25_V]EQC44297.1 glutamate synthase domain protein [Bacteriovorax sp. Seq25_V]